MSRFKFFVPPGVEGTCRLKKKVLKYGVTSVIDFIHFQYLVNEKYHHDLYESNLKMIKETKPPEFKFDANILIKKGFKEDANLGNAINFLKQRWVANNYEIRDKDIDDAIQLFK